MAVSTETIHTLQFQDYWARLHNETLSFGKCGEENDVHLTVSFSSKSNHINFHVSRNVGLDGEKPKIEILRIDKAQLEANAERLMLLFLKVGLKPLNIKRLKRKYHSGLWYIPHPSENSEQTRIWNDAVNLLIAQSGKQSGKRLKFTLALEEAIIKVSHSTYSIDDVLSRIRRASRQAVGMPEAGSLIIGKRSLSVIRIGKHWYTYVDGKRQLKSLVSRKLYLAIKWRYLKAYAQIRSAKSYNDTKHLNPGLTLVLRLPQNLTKN